MSDEFQAQWRDRLASGSRLAAKSLAQAAKEDASRVAALAALARDPLPAVRMAALRALATVAESQAGWVALHAQVIVEALAAPELDAQEAGLAALGSIASRAPAEAALALPLIAELLASARRPSLREEAARCLGRIGGEVPGSAPVVADRLATHLSTLRNPKAAQEAREILAALETLLPHLLAGERVALFARVAPLRAHPNIQVRERAGRVSRMLTA